MQADLPHTLFLHDKTSGDPSKNTRPSDKVLQLQEEANRRMLERKAAKERGEETYDSVDELFNQNTQQ